MGRTVNLTPFQKIEISYRRPQIQKQIEIGKEQQLRKSKSVSLISEKQTPIDIIKTISEDTGVGYDTTSKAIQIIKKADPETLDELRKREKTINRAYINTKRKDRKEEYKKKVIENKLPKDKFRIIYAYVESLEKWGNWEFKK